MGSGMYFQKDADVSKPGISQASLAKLCEIEGLDDINCVECSAFDGCRMILYDSAS